MKRITVSLTLVVLFGLAATTRAQSPAYQPAPVQLSVPLDGVPFAPVPAVGPVLPTVKALTLREFACADFRPGTYAVYLIHPCTHCPVKVCFSLPVCPRKVRASANTLELRWGPLCGRKVIVRFLPDGTVSVRG